VIQDILIGIFGESLLVGISVFGGFATFILMAMATVWYGNVLAKKIDALWRER